MPIVTVVTATYQHARFIDACIKSVLAQSFRDWEMIVVDDGSTDGTPERVEAYEDPRIRLIRQSHRGLGGLADTCAAALKISGAEFVAILEGDDAWPPSKLTTQLPLLDDPTVVLSYGAAGLIDEYGCQYARYWRRPEGQVAANDPVGSILPALALGNFVVSPTVVLRRSVLDEIGGFVQPDGRFTQGAAHLASQATRHSHGPGWQHLTKGALDHSRSLWERAMGTRGSGEALPGRSRRPRQSGMPPCSSGSF